MPDQLEIFFRAQDSQVLALEDFLLARRGWITATQYLRQTGVNETDSAKRQLRALAESSQCIISGQKGYRHIRNATAEEIQHFVRWMERQAKKMITRAEAVRRRAHQQLG